MVLLEDELIDIIGKAQKGLELSDGDICARGGLSRDSLSRVRENRGTDGEIRSVAVALGLGADQLVAVARRAYQPEPVDLPGLVQFEAPFGEYKVNYYLTADPERGEGILFDTGTTARAGLAYLAEHKLALGALAITHADSDHIDDVERVRSETGVSQFYAPDLEPLDGATRISEGDTFAVGMLRATAIRTAGHTRGGTTFQVEGLSRPVAIVGDAIFAGSIGGTRTSYADSVGHVRDKILTLPDETIICPGHGPMTTVGEEKRNNPFFG